jgi:hypothetical protein
VADVPSGLVSHSTPRKLKELEFERLFHLEACKLVLLQITYNYFGV